MALPTGHRLGGRSPRLASDPEVARRLGDLLAKRRRRGEPWDAEAFDALASIVVQDLDPHEATAWVLAFREQRDVWRAGFERTLEFRVQLELG